jgi:ankyrin repeat protein
MSRPDPFSRPSTWQWERQYDSWFDSCDRLRVISQDDRDNHSFARSRLSHRSTEYLYALSRIEKDLTLSTENAEYLVCGSVMESISLAIAVTRRRDPHFSHFHMAIPDPDGTMAKLVTVFNGGTSVIVRAERKFVKRVIAALCAPNSAFPPCFSPDSVPSRWKTSQLFEEVSISLDPESFRHFVWGWPHDFVIKAAGREFACNRLGVALSSALSAAGGDEFVYEADVAPHVIERIVTYLNGLFVEFPRSCWADATRVAGDLGIDTLSRLLDTLRAFAEKVAQIRVDEAFPVDAHRRLDALLVDLVATKVEDALTPILSDWFSDDIRIQELVNRLVYLASKRNDLGRPFALLIRRLHQLTHSDVLLEYVRRRVLRTLSDGPFLWSLFQEHLIPLDLITKSIVAFVYESVNFDVASKDEHGHFTGTGNPSIGDSANMMGRFPLAFYWFLPELCHSHPHIVCLFETLCSKWGDSYGYDRSFTPKKPRSEMEIVFARELAGLGANDWQRFRELRERGCHFDPLVASLANDDVKSFRLLFADAECTWNLTVPPFPLTNTQPQSLLAAAASAKATHCVKFLLDGGAYVGLDEMNAAMSDRAIVELFLPRLAQKVVQKQPGQFVYRPFSSAMDAKDLLTCAVMYSRPEYLERGFDECGGKYPMSAWGLVDEACRSGSFACLAALFDVESQLVVPSVAALANTIISHGFYDMLLFIDRFVTDPSMPPFCGNSIFRSKDDWMTFPVHAAKDLFETIGATGSVAMFNYVRNKLGDVVAPWHFGLAVGTAARHGFVDFVKYLIESVPPQGITESILRILAQAALSGSSEILLMLLPFAEADCDLTEIAKTAAACHHFDFLKVLVDQNRLFIVPVIFSAAVECGNVEGDKLFLEKKGPIELEDMETPVVRAVTANSLEAIRLVLELVSDDERRRIVSKALEAAIESKKGDIALFFLSIGDSCSCSLAGAVSTNSIALVRFVLARDSSPHFVNQITPNGTALCIAAASGSFDIVELLLSIPGINPGLPSANGHTPLVLAAMNKHPRIVARLVEFYGGALERQFWQINRALLEAFDSSPPHKVQCPPERDERQKHWSELDAFSPSFRYSPCYMRPLQLVRVRSRCEPADAAMSSELISVLFGLPGVDLNFSEGGRTLLLIAAFQKNLVLMQAILGSSTRIRTNSYDMDGTTPIIACACNHDLCGIKLLLNYPGTQINWQDRSGATALSTAACNGDFEIVDFLVHADGFDADASNSVSAIINAIMRKSSHISNLLLALDFDINAKSVDESPKAAESETVLDSAVHMSNFDAVAQVLKHPRFSPRRSDLRETVFLASRSAPLPLVRAVLALLDNDVNIRNRRKVSFLTKACLDNRPEIVDFILAEPSFDPALNDLMQAIRATLSFDNVSVLRRLLAIPGVDVNGFIPPDPTEAPPFDDQNGWGETVFGDELWKSKRNRSQDGLVLTVALGMGAMKSIEFLLSHPKIDLGRKDRHGKTVLFEALSYVQWFPMIIACQGVDINCQDETGNTVLHYAVIERIGWAAALLVADGIDLGIRNHRGETAWDLAPSDPALCAIGAERAPAPEDRDEYRKQIVRLLRR